MVAILVLVFDAVMVAMIISIMLVLFHRRNGVNMSCGHDQHESSRQYIPLYTVISLLHCLLVLLHHYFLSLYDCSIATALLFVLYSYCYCCQMMLPLRLAIAMCPKFGACPLPAAWLEGARNCQQACV